MKHRSKVEVWLFAAILYVVGVLAAGGNRWIGGPVLLVLLLIALPQEYVTAPEALRVRAGLTRWAIPYGAITFVGESSLGPVLGQASRGAHRTRFGNSAGAGRSGRLLC